MSIGEVTREGDLKIKTWINSKERIESLKRQQNGAECDYRNAENDLGRWLCPGDAKVGESFCVWYGDSLSQATKRDQGGLGTFEVKIRRRGRSI